VERLGLIHIGTEVSGTNLCANIYLDVISYASKIILKVSNKKRNLVSGVCHGRFHGILTKEYSRTFHEPSWGLYKEMHTNIRGQSDVVTHSAKI
jgi:hypothetical protein